MCYEILLQDDYPDLRKMGGTGDRGVDAVDEAFYDDTVHTRAVVQVTGQRAQKKKLASTIKRLREAGKNFDKLIVVFQHPVESATKRELQATASDAGIVIDIRDQNYLVAQLGRTANGIFNRYFGDVRTQVDFLLGQEDPLGNATDPARRAMLASLAAFVLNPSASATRLDFFDQAVLAVVVAAGAAVEIERLGNDVAALLAGGRPSRSEVLASVARLVEAGQCVLENGNPAPSDAAIETVGSAITFLSKAIDRVREGVLGHVAQRLRLDDAARGHIERNVKRALVRLFRLIGPTVAPVGDVCDHLAALNSFARDEANSGLLANLARSYAALELRNMNPATRRFQQLALSRPQVILDTDAILVLAIEELPEHRAVLDSLRALVKEDVRVVIPRPMLQEALSHIERAPRTYLRFAASLDRLPQECVDAEVWHAIVRGYYNLAANPREPFHSYWQKYFSKESPADYLTFVLKKRCEFEIIEEMPLDPGDREHLAAILPGVLARKERARWKAAFRDEAMMKQRVEVDLQCALYAARRCPDAAVPDAMAYLVSRDSAFSYLQTLPQWPPRPRVHLWTTDLPRLAEFALGVRLHDDEIVGIVFNPLHVAAAEQIGGGIHELAKVGVDLRGVPLERLEWDTTHGLREALLANRALETSGAPEEARLASLIALSRAAAGLGYPIDGAMGDVIESYDRLKRSLEAEQNRRARAEEVARRLIDAASGLTKKGKRRVHQILHELDEEATDAPDDDSEEAPV
jgi:hypothetical protein